MLHADPDHPAVVGPQAGHERREVGVSGDDHEGVDARIVVAEVQGVDDHADVGGVLAGPAAGGDVDELEPGLVHGPLLLVVAGPVGIDALEHDPSFLEHTLEERTDLERHPGLPCTDRDIVEVDEDGDGFGVPVHLIASRALVVVVNWMKS